MSGDPRGSWGIEPVPDRLRVLGVFDTGLLWGNLGVSLLVLAAGAYLVPALSLPQALVVVVVGALVGNAMLATAALIGADARVPAMVLMRAPLGRRGSALPTVVNVVQCLGWATFELLVISTAAAALSDDLIGVRAQWAWTLGFGALAWLLAIAGPIGVVRRFIRKAVGWTVPLALAYLTWWALSGTDLGDLWGRPGEGGLSTWQGIDLVVGITVSWIPLAADYTRFSRSRRAAFWGSGIGYLIPDAWLIALGAVIFLSRDLSDPTALPAAVVAGGVAAGLALLALTVTEVDEAFANVYSAGVSTQNLAATVSQRLLVGVAAALATVGALLLNFGAFESFLFLLGSLFVPLFAVLLADWLAAGRAYPPERVFAAPAWRPGLIGAWVAGFVLYQWLQPTGPSAWVALVERLDPPGWGIGATLPAFVVSFVVALVVALTARLRARL